MTHHLSETLIDAGKQAGQMAAIFISYRRDDAAASAGRLYDTLINHFGADQVVRDVDTIPPGVDFARWISDAVGKCQALLVVIGPHWLTASDAKGNRRLDDPRDWVRLEIKAALQRSIPVVPVMVEGADLPSAGELPKALARLTKLQAVELSHAHWKGEVEQLIRGLELVVDGPETPATASGPAPQVPERAPEVPVPPSTATTADVAATESTTAPAPPAQPAPSKPGMADRLGSDRLLGLAQLAMGLGIVAAAFLPWVHSVFTGDSGGSSEHRRNGLEILHNLGAFTLVLGAAIAILGTFLLASRQLPIRARIASAVAGAAVGAIGLIKLSHTGHIDRPKGSWEVDPQAGLYLTLILGGFACAAGLVSVAMALKSRRMLQRPGATARPASL